jgi:hypothetical protein
MSLPRLSWKTCFRALLRLATSSPESSWVFEPFKFLLELESCGSCNKHSLLKTFECL